jgi:hypothetical protein
MPPPFFSTSLSAVDAPEFEALTSIIGRFLRRTCNNQKLPQELQEPRNREIKGFGYGSEKTRIMEAVTGVRKAVQRF